MNSRFSFCASVVSVLALLLCVTSQLAAQAVSDDTTRAAARELAQQGIDAYRAANYAEADRKLEKAYRLFATPTLGLWCARARMQLGQWVQAAERYREARLASAAVGDSAMQQQAQTEADEELAALTARMPALTLELHGSDEADVSLSIDGAALSSELFGVRLPMNPGAHRIVVSRGNARAEVEIKLVEKEHKLVPLRLENASPAAVAARPQAPQQAAADSNLPLPAAGVSDHQVGGVVPVRPLAIAAVALGGASLAASAVSALLASGRCSGGECASTSDQVKYDPLRTTSVVTFWAGALLAAGGVVGWIVAPRQPNAGKEQAFRLDVGPFGVSVRGAL